MTAPRLLLVSPRPPRADGQGDQRRAHVALAALSEDWDVEVISWLPEAGERAGRQLFTRPASLLRAVLLSMVRPLQVAYVQSLAPRSLRRRLGAGAPALFMTDRAVPLRPGRPFAVDFIDDLAGAARRRAAAATGMAAVFWRWEGARLARLDRRLATQATVAIAITDADAAVISPRVATIPAAIAAGPMKPDGDKIVFAGNLFYQPNFEAAMWVCDELAPELARRGIDGRSIVIAGRRPPALLYDRAAAAGIDLRPDVADLTDVLREAAVVVVPVIFGSGVQNKILDAVGAGRPCVITAFTNRAVGLVDGRSALVRDRRTGAFADAVAALWADPSLGQELAAEARRQLTAHTPGAVAAAWRAGLAPLHRANPEGGT